MFLKPKLGVISGDDFEMIHQATLRLLEGTGIVFHHDEVLKILKIMVPRLTATWCVCPKNW
jgi:trimethylamine:corrinoid methyltransferase-like protein